jgi:hypothetical protein
MRAKNAKDIDRIFEDGKLIDKALADATREAVLRHKQLGLPIVVYRKGETVWIPAEKIRVGGRGQRRKGGSRPINS